MALSNNMNALLDGTLNVGKNEIAKKGNDDEDNDKEENKVSSKDKKGKDD